MCISIPLQVIESGDAIASCRGRNGEEQVNMLLVGAQPAGTWVLVFLGWAREVISAEDAKNINLALDGLSAVMQGEAEIDIDRYFPGLAATTEAKQ